MYQLDACIIWIILLYSSFGPGNDVFSGGGGGGGDGGMGTVGVATAWLLIPYAVQATKYHISTLWLV